jgi:hypothetical protein
VANIKEAIKGYVKALEEDGLPMPNERFETSWSRYEPVARHLWPGVCQGLGKNCFPFKKREGKRTLFIVDKQNCCAYN